MYVLQVKKAESDNMDKNMTLVVKNFDPFVLLACDPRSPARAIMIPWSRLFDPCEVATTCSYFFVLITVTAS